MHDSINILEEDLQYSESHTGPLVIVCFHCHAIKNKIQNRSKKML